MKKTSSDWRQIIEDQKQSGTTISGYCKQHGLSISNFYSRRRALESRSSGQKFVPVEIGADTTKEKPNRLLKITSSKGFTVEVFL